MTAAEQVPGRSGLLEQLMAIVRPEFRTDIYIPAPDDPVFVADECAVADCDRTAVSIRRGLCNAHAIRFRKRGRPPMEDFLADPGPPVRGRRPLAPCIVDGCRYGTWRQERAVFQAPRPVEPGRQTRTWRPGTHLTWPRATPRQPSAGCRSATSGSMNPTKIFCTGHDDRWQRHGRPDPDRFIADCELVGTACIDLRDLSPQLKLEIQYALQCRHDARSRTAAPRLVMPAVRHVQAAGVTSLLDLTEQQWRQSAGSQVGESALFLIDARDALETLRDGTGWEIEYPRDVWRLHKLPGITIPAGRPCPRARLRFDRITQPWLRELAKRWTRLRLTSGLSIGAARAGVDALTCFSTFLALAGVDTLADVDRPLLERYLAHVAAQPGGHGMKKTRIGGLNLFFQNIRQHGWDDTLPGTAAFYPGDTPPVPEQVDRRLAEYVMAQVEAPANLDRWPSPAGRLITLILIRCGLRISSALALDFDCLLHDGQGAPYLRYFNTKMRREAAVPIDEELEAAIRDQQRRVLDQWPDGTTCLFPRPRANVSGNLPLADSSYRRMLGRWLATCDIRDEHGRPVHLTPHQWRHTFACRLINRDVPARSRPGPARPRFTPDDLALRQDHRPDGAAALGAGHQGQHQRRARHPRPGRPARPSPMGQDPVRHGHPDPAQRLLRAADPEELPARQRVPDLPGLPDRPGVPARTARTASPHAHPHRGRPPATGQTRVAEMNQQVLTNLDRMIGEIENDDETEAADAG